MTKRIAMLAAGLLALSATGAAQAPSAADSAAIRQAALDYIEGWYEGDAARMERAVHPELAKRWVRAGESGGSMLRDMGASELVAQTRRGGGRDVPPAQRRRDVTILDVHRDMATAKIVSARLVDYLHLARLDGRWRIVNVLWDVLPTP